MADRALIRSGAVIRKFNGEKGWVELEGGGKVSPPVIGYVNGNDKIVAVETETTDTSTGPDTVNTRVETVEANRVLIAVSIRDMTAQELADRETARLDGAEQQIEVDPALKALSQAVFEILNDVRTLNSQAPITKTAFNTWLRVRMS